MQVYFRNLFTFYECRNEILIMANMHLFPEHYPVYDILLLYFKALLGFLVVTFFIYHFGNLLYTCLGALFCWFCRIYLVKWFRIASEEMILRCSEQEKIFYLCEFRKLKERQFLMSWQLKYLILILLRVITLSSFMLHGVVIAGSWLQRGMSWLTHWRMWI